MVGEEKNGHTNVLSDEEDEDSRESWESARERAESGQAGEADRMGAAAAGDQAAGDHLLGDGWRVTGSGPMTGGGRNW